MSQQFWVNDPCILFTDIVFFPVQSMTPNEKLNAITRLVLLITIIMIACRYEYWAAFLLVGLVIVLLGKLIIVPLISTPTSETIENFSVSPTYVPVNANMYEVCASDGIPDVSPVYSDYDFKTITVPPVFSEEWRSPPPCYDSHDVSADLTDLCDIEDDRPVYAQYITPSNLLPYQQLGTFNQTLDYAKLYMNDEFTKDTLQFRNDMTRLFTNKVDRWYRGGCYDALSSKNNGPMLC